MSIQKTTQKIHIDSTTCGADLDTSGSNWNESDEDVVMTHVDKQQESSNELDIRKQQDELMVQLKNLHQMKVMKSLQTYSIF